MGKAILDVLMDQAPDYVEANCDQINLNAGEPTTYAEATSGSKFLGSTSVSSTDFTVADGDGSGRKVNTSKQDNVSVSTTGEWDHISWVDTSSSDLLAVTTKASQQVSSGSTVDIPSIDIEFQDPD